MQGTGDKLQAQLTTFNSSAGSTSVLAIAESTIQIDLQMRQRMMQLLQNEELYADILQHLQDPTQSNELVKNERTYRIKQGILKIHEPDQATDYSYWRTVVPNNQEVKIELLREIHCVPYSGHPGFTRTLGSYKKIFLLGTYDPRGTSICP